MERERGTNQARQTKREGGGKRKKMDINGDKLKLYAMLKKSGQDICVTSQCMHMYKMMDTA